MARKPVSGKEDLPTPISPFDLDPLGSLDAFGERPGNPPPKRGVFLTRGKLHDDTGGARERKSRNIWHRKSSCHRSEGRARR